MSFVSQCVSHCVSQCVTSRIVFLQTSKLNVVCPIIPDVEVVLNPKISQINIVSYLNPVT